MNYVITIGREFASGGRTIARKLSKELNIPFYDREIIELAAKKSGLSEEVIEHASNRKTSSFLYNLYFASNELPIPDQVFLVQSDIIRNAAKNGPCIIVGRCADYILRDDPNCLRVFIHAPLSERVRRARDEYGLNEPHLEKYIAAQDKKRASYYYFYSDKKWGMSQNYHLSIDSSIGIDLSVSLLKGLVEEKVKEKR